MTARLLLARQLSGLEEIDWTVVSGDPYDDAPESIDVRVIPLRRELASSDVGCFARLLGYFRRKRFGFVQTHTPKASFLGLPAARLARVPALYTVHGSLYFRGNGVRANLLGWVFERWCCAWATKVLVQSREDETALARAWIANPRKVAYIGNGIDLDHFDHPVAPAIRSERPLVLMVSRLVREKGCLDFIQLARLLRADAEFVHVGPFEDDQRDAISEAEVSRATGEGTVTFVGGVDDVRPYLASADVVVLPSYREGIPRAAMEAAAMGRPVVAYDIRGVREVVEPGLGLLAPRGDVGALARILAGLLEDPDRRVRLGRECQQRVRGLFSEGDVIERLRRVYQQMALVP